MIYFQIEYFLQLDLLTITTDCCAPTFPPPPSIDSATGQMKTTSIAPVDLKTVHGALDMCAGSVTPWDTHLGGEEFDPDGEGCALTHAELTQ